MSNAIKFSDQYGVVQVRVKKVNSQQIVEKDYIQLCVTDNGRGIKKKDQKLLFKLYGSIKG